MPCLYHSRWFERLILYALYCAVLSVLLSLSLRFKYSPFWLNRITYKSCSKTFGETDTILIYVNTILLSLNLTWKEPFLVSDDVKRNVIIYCMQAASIYSCIWNFNTNLHDYTSVTYKSLSKYTLLRNGNKTDVFVSTYRLVCRTSRPPFTTLSI